ncbi:MAG: hypothetical protein WCF85_11105 [Rhodospirillaceae bacterium]
MTAINTGYTNYFSNPAAVTSTPANFGPGQLKTDEQTDNSQKNAQKATETDSRANSGYTDETRGGKLNIVV